MYKLLDNIDNINDIPPLSCPAFIWLMEKAFLIITDSGGVEEEEPSLGNLVLVIHDTTKRPEAVEAGTVLLVGTDKEKMVFHTNILLNNSDAYVNMSKLHNPYGEGTACKK